MTRPGRALRPLPETTKEERLRHLPAPGVPSLYTPGVRYAPDPNVEPPRDRNAGDCVDDAGPCPICGRVVVDVVEHAPGCAVAHGAKVAADAFACEPDTRAMARCEVCGAEPGAFHTLAIVGRGRR